MIELLACQTMIDFAAWARPRHGVNGGDCWNRENGGEQWEFPRTMFP